MRREAIRRTLAPRAGEAADARAVAEDGIVIGDPVLDYEGLLGGRPMRTPACETVD